MSMFDDPRDDPTLYQPCATTVGGVRKILRVEMNSPPKPEKKMQEMQEQLSHRERFYLWMALIIVSGGFITVVTSIVMAKVL